MDYEREIPFGVFDSELMHQEISIPDGFTATIEGDKIILTRTESEDEKIRKAIHIYLDWLDGRKDYAPRGEYTIRDMIAWLEKQGESTDINPSEFDLRLNKLLKQFETLSKEELTSSLSFYLNVIQNDGTYREEKQGEQKPTDKVEPKFHKGGWVVDNAGYIWKIKGILNKFYILEGVEGGESRPTTEWADDTFHLWTIQDAKDGDVLVSESTCGLNTWYCIFKSLDGDESMTVYCYLARDGRFETKKELCFDKDPYNTNPATKEQYDLLFQKMKEAGYEWDAEKKELKKIEQNPANIFNIYEKSLLEKFKQAVYDCAWGKVTCKKEGETQEEYAERWAEQFLLMVRDWADDYIDFTIQQQLRRSYDKGKENAIKENISSWSEEDEDIRDTIIRDLKRLGGDIVNVKPAYKEEVDWLKSLKRRIGWKPSEEQMKALHDLNLTGNISYAGQGQVLIELYNDLEELIK